VPVFVTPVLVGIDRCTGIDRFIDLDEELYPIVKLFGIGFDLGEMVLSLFAD